MQMNLDAPADDAVLRPILETVLDAVIVMSVAGDILAWNSVAEQVFGWVAAEAIGVPLADLIVPAQHRAAHNAGLRRMAKGAEPRVLNRLIEISAIRKDGSEIPIELSITATTLRRGKVFIGFLRDITRRLEVERKLQRQALESHQMLEIAQMAAEADSFDNALREVLEAICKVSGWPVGHAFLVLPGHASVLVSSKIWVEAKPGAAHQLRQATERCNFIAGVGLPGVILQTGRPHWIPETAAAENFPRKGLGFGGAFGFPIKDNGRTIAILEFFSETEADPDPELLLFAQALGEQIGRVFERKRTEERQALLVHELNHRVKNMLAVVMAISRQTIAKSTDLRQAQETLTGRLLAISSAQDLIIVQRSKGTTLMEIVLAALKGSGVEEDRFAITGPDIAISAENAVNITLGIHELATNALKYGALSTSAGAVQIKWGRLESVNPPTFQFEWLEHGGPLVSKPQKKGFGTSLLERGLAGSLGGSLELLYNPEGFSCKFRAPIPEIAPEAAT